MGAELLVRVRAVGRRTVLAMGGGCLAGCGGGGERNWLDEVVWREGNLEADPVEKVGSFGRMALSPDLQNREVEFLDTSADGRCLIYRHAEPGRGRGGVTRMGAVDMDAGDVRWTVRPGRFLVWQACWNGRSPILWMTVEEPGVGAVGLAVARRGCQEAPEPTGVRLREARQGGSTRIAVGDGECYFSRDGEILRWRVGGSREERVAKGTGVAVSPDGRRLSVRDSGGAVRILDARTGRVAREIAGWFTDAGKWAPDGERLLLDGPVELGVRIPWPVLSVYTIGDGRRHGAVPNRAMVGTSKVFWVGWREASWKRVTRDWLVRAAGGVCGGGGR